MWVHHGGENPQRGIHRIDKIGQQRTALAQSSGIGPDVGSRSEITDPDKKKNEINRDLTASRPSAGTPTWTRAARLEVMSMILRIMMIVMMVVIVMMVMMMMLM